MGLLGPYIYMSVDLTEKVGQFSGPYMYGYLFFKKNLFQELWDLRELICISLDLTKKLEQFLGPSWPSGPYMYGYIFFKKSFKFRDLLVLICTSPDLTKNLEQCFGTFGTLYVCLFFKKTCFILGTFVTSYVPL